MSRTELTPRQRWALATMAGQAEGLAELEAEVLGAGDAVDRCRRWMALARQASRVLELAEASLRGRAVTGLTAEVAAHKEMLRATMARAGRAARACGPDLERQARHRLGLRLAVVGKGGAGKTAITATLARLLARRRRNVLAVDLDTNPGLAFSLGMPHDTPGLPPEAVEEQPGAAYGWQLAAALSPARAVERFALPAPDGVRYVGVGKIEEADKQAARRTMIAVLQVLRGFADPDWDVVADLEAGPTTPFEGYHTFAERVMVIVGPEWRSALTARRLMTVLGAVPTLVVANRWREGPDHPGLDPAVRVPFDPAVIEAERLGLAPLDACPGSPAVRAVEDLADRLTELQEVAS